MALLDKLIKLFRLQPNPKRIAKQLRKPSGAIAHKVAEKMNESNAPLYALALQEMKLSDGEKVLEIGFANGYFFNQLFSSAKNLHISGLDFSPEMVKTAKVLNTEHLEAETLDLRLGSSDAMPFEDARFDKVFCVNLIYFWDSPSEHLSEVLRVLKPGGRFYTIIRTKETLKKMPFTQYGFKLYEAQEWASTLEGAGFKAAQVVEHTEPPVYYEGQPFQLSSLCISASK